MYKHQLPPTNVEVVMEQRVYITSLFKPRLNDIVYDQETGHGAVVVKVNDDKTYDTYGGALGEAFRVQPDRLVKMVPFVDLATAFMSLN